MTYQIFAEEKDLETQLQDDGNYIIACLSSVVEGKSLLSLEAKTSVKASDDGQFDLQKLYTILVSTGWNKNDEYFLQSEVWKARHSATDKPFNYEHDSRNVIGHITGSSVVDVDYDIVADDCKVEDLPNKFHVLTSAVLYKGFVFGRDKLLANAMKTLLSEIEKDEWYVSVESFFKHFDYCLESSDGIIEIVERNDQTSYLTKHLRIFGGSGVYEDKKLGRVPRNMIFAGKGLVRKPGNPESFVFTDPSVFKGLEAKLSKTTETTPMTVAGIEVQPLSDKMIETINKTIQESLSANLKETETDMSKEVDVTKLEAQIAELTKSVNDNSVKVADKDSKIASLEAALAEAVKVSNEGKVAAEQVVETLRAELATSKAEVTRFTRLNLLANKNIPAEKQEEILTKFGSLDATQFETIVSVYAEPVKDEKAVEKVEAAEKTVEETNLEALEASEKVTKVIPTGEEVNVELNTLRASIADYMKA